MAGAVAWAISAVVTGEPVLAIATPVPVATVTAIGTLGRGTGDPDPSRRRAILSGATAIAALIGGIGLQELAAEEEPDGAVPAPIDEDVAGLMADAEDKSLDIAGDVPGLVSSFEEFYNVDIAQFDPELTAEDWTLTLTGEVTEDVTVTFEDLTAMPTEHRFVRLRCVGESLNGHKLDTAVWTDTPIAPLLEAVAKLWSDTVLENGNVEVAGHAYAGTRGVERVEVSIDGSSTWDPAELLEPLPGDDVWRQWRYEFPPDGSHEIVVRAVDGEGAVQPQERSRSFPSGATGWVNTRVTV